MIKYYILSSFFLVSNCQSEKKNIETKASEIQNTQQPYSIEILPNKALVFTEKQTGNEYIVTDNNITTVVKIEYNEALDKQYQDNFYSETILFQIDSKNQNIQISNSELLKLPLLLDKKCYCKGQAGVHKIEIGSLQLTINGKQVSGFLQIESKTVSIKNKVINFKNI